MVHPPWHHGAEQRHQPCQRSQHVRRALLCGLHCGAHSPAHQPWHRAAQQCHQPYCQRSQHSENTQYTQLQAPQMFSNTFTLALWSSATARVDAASTTGEHFTGEFSSPPTVALWTSATSHGSALQKLPATSPLRYSSAAPPATSAQPAQQAKSGGCPLQTARSC
eukprot:1160563-Pelagomonas_calceolata.AAC.7